uniref:G-protein coupled receptors family 1 profile domain-containing protein n=1 Tax=Hucho hucho TaxID=62062 RepID=A0A4W5LPW7_9TELE
QSLCVHSLSNLKTVMVVLISSGFIVAWSPYVVLSFWYMFQRKASLAPLVSLLPCLFAKGSTAYNPFIYYIFRRSFRRQLRQLRGLICCSAQPDTVLCLSPLRNHQDSRANLKSETLFPTSSTTFMVVNYVRNSGNSVPFWRLLETSGSNFYSQVFHILTLFM